MAARIAITTIAKKQVFQDREDRLGGRQGEEPIGPVLVEPPGERLEKLRVEGIGGDEGHRHQAAAIDTISRLCSCSRVLNR
jgi:hypothetical protein